MKLERFEAWIYPDQREFLAAVKRKLRKTSKAEVLRHIIDEFRKSYVTSTEESSISDKVQ